MSSEDEFTNVGNVEQQIRDCQSMENKNRRLRMEAIVNPSLSSCSLLSLENSLKPMSIQDDEISPNQELQNSFSVDCSIKPKISATAEKRIVTCILMKFGGMKMEDACKTSGVDRSNNINKFDN